MKNLFLSVIFATIAFVSNAQVVTVPGSKYPFYSDIISFKQSEYNDLIEIVPINKVDLNATPIVLNEGAVRANMVDAINRLRSQYGVKPLKYSKSLAASIHLWKTDGIPFDGPITYSEYSTFLSFNYVRNFSNKEEKFCDMIFDLQCYDEESLLQLINPNSTIIGFNYSQNPIDQTYSITISIK